MVYFSLMSVRTQQLAKQWLRGPGSSMLKLHHLTFLHFQLHRKKGERDGGDTWFLTALAQKTSFYIYMPGIVTRLQPKWRGDWEMLRSTRIFGYCLSQYFILKFQVTLKKDLRFITMGWRLRKVIKHYISRS